MHNDAYLYYVYNGLPVLDDGPIMKCFDLTIHNIMSCYVPISYICYHNIYMLHARDKNANCSYHQKLIIS